MEPILISDAEIVDDTTDAGVLVHAWPVAQLQRLGLPRILAEMFPELVDWNEIAS
jgi:hypothetical protein